MTTKEQYEAAKKIVDEYECDEYMKGMMDADEDDLQDDYDDMQERQDEEDLERAHSCTCGAYVVSKTTGKGIHVSDCLCGAD